MKLRDFFKINDPTYLDALSKASTIGLHMVSGVAVGGLMGYGLDMFFDSKPWCLIILLVFGVAAGFRNVYLDTSRLLKMQEEQDAEKYKKKP